jgi:sugar lactone lactonase YvrE
MNKSLIRAALVAACCVAIAIAIYGCGRDEGSSSGVLLSSDTLATGDGDLTKASSYLVPGGYYSFDWEVFAYSALEHIDYHTGQGTYMWSIGLTDQSTPDVFGPSPFGLAFDLDGTIFTMLNFAAFDPALVSSQLARVDPETGEVTTIGEPFNLNTSGPEMDACGNFWVCGFEVPALGYIWGDSNLYRIDKYTGDRTLIGDTGKTNWMDLAFDSKGTLWATTENALWTLDLTTGASTFVTEIHDVPDAGEPRWMEVMSITFDDADVMYGTAMTVYYDDPEGSPVMRIDPETGETVQLGHTQNYYNHGGDTYPTTVHVAHRTGKGGYKCIKVNMNALGAHLAHGDYVPGTNGYSCDCP